MSKEQEEKGKEFKFTGEEPFRDDVGGALPGFSTFNAGMARPKSLKGYNVFTWLGHVLTTKKTKPDKSDLPQKGKVIKIVIYSLIFLVIIYAWLMCYGIDLLGIF